MERDRTHKMCILSLWCERRDLTVCGAAAYCSLGAPKCFAFRYRPRASGKTGEARFSSCKNVFLQDGRQRERRVNEDFGDLSRTRVLPCRQSLQAKRAENKLAVQPLSRLSEKMCRWHIFLTPKPSRVRIPQYKKSSPAPKG